MKKLLDIAGVTVLGMIEENIRKGIDYEGKPFAYSEKTFFRPYDEKLYNKLKKSIKAEEGIAEVVTSKKSGKLGFIIFGYKKFKAYVRPDAAKDFLTWDGKMLRNMKVLKTSEEEAIIGFSDDKQAKKAFYFNVSGVGRSRKLWKFLGISEEQEKRLGDLVGKEYVKITIAELGKIIAKNKP